MALRRGKLMQFFNRVSAIIFALIGIVVLLLFGSKGLFAQHYLDSPPPIYGHVPSGFYGGQGAYEVHPSPGYFGGYYDHSLSYPVLPAQPVPTPSVPEEAAAAKSPPYGSAVVTSDYKPDSGHKHSTSELSKPNASAETSGFEKLRNALRDLAPKADATLGLENGLKKSVKELVKQRAVNRNPVPDLTTEEATPKPPLGSDAPTAVAEASETVAEAVEPVASMDSTGLEKQSSQPTPNPLTELLAVQARIDAALPRLLPAVIAVEGGSGVIVSSEGHVLTASHVTKKSGRTILVKLADGRTVQATTLGTNVNSDTAALKLAGNGPWPHVTIGDSASVELGQWCLALGYPLSFERGGPAAVRLGRIFQKSRSRFVTDSPIMGGDSGGPLFDLDGKLVAISSRIKSDVNQNLFVPIERYQTEWQQLTNGIDVPKMEHALAKTYLGILGETDADRVRIRRVYQGSPAAKAGLLENDVIISFDGKRIGDFDDVANVLKSRKPGEEVIAQLNRFGTLINVPIRLGSSGGG